MKNIKEYFDYLYSLERSGMKYDLTNIKALLKHIGNPHLNFRSIHVAGTNGKGATASLVSSILIENGLKTGLFTSPHILTFNERIRVGSKKISNNYVKDFLNNNFRFIKKIKPSFFEVNTAIAFKYFADKKVDVAVIECGLGGRLDSTNVLKPEVCVITQIGMDHMQFLGNTIEQIAFEKLGIVKSRTPVVVSDNNSSLRMLFKKSIKDKNLYYLGDKLSGYHDKLLNSPLSGNFQKRNIAASILSAKIFCDSQNLALPEKAILNGIRKVKYNSGYMGRLEMIKSSGRNYVFDVSHNPDGIKNTLSSIGMKKTDIIVFGIMADKDYRKSIKEIMKHSGIIILTKPQYARALEPKVLYNLVVKSGYKGKVYLTQNVKEAVKILEKIKAKNILFIGSFFLVSDAIKALKFQKYFNY